MLKKFGIICVFLIFSTLIIFSNCLFLGESVSGVKSGKSSGKIIQAKSYPFNGLIGVYKQFNGDYDYDSLIKKYNAKLIIVESVDGVCNYYYYSKKLPKVEIIDKKKVNIQIAVSRDKVVVGSPIIYGGF